MIWDETLKTKNSRGFGKGCTVTMKFTAEDFRDIQIKAAKAGVTNAEYCRRKVLGKEAR